MQISAGDSLEREILPVYPLTENLTQKVLRRIIKENIDAICNFKELIPDELIFERGLIDVRKAYMGMHFPKSIYHQKISRKRLAYEELLLLQLALMLSRKTSEKIGGISKTFSGELAERFVHSLPFKLTNAQVRAHQELSVDLKSSNQ